MRKIAHLINPVHPIPGQDHSSLAVAQPVTFASLQSARRHARPGTEVEILAIGFPEDASVVPDDFTVTRSLQRSVLDIATFAVPRKLPILRDIIEIGLASTDAEYFIYTNIDIGVTDNFYAAIDAILDQGYDAFTITRRTIPAHRTNPADLALIQSMAGEVHPGHDCFIVHRSILENMTIGETCLGAQYLVPPFLANLICRAKKFGRFDEFHLTFHLGDDRVWKTDTFQDYADFNHARAVETLLAMNQAGLLVPSRYVNAWIDRFALKIPYPKGPSVHVPLWTGLQSE